MDYRYFPEPDLLPLNLSDEFVSEIEKLKVELPITRRLRYLNEYKLGVDDARILTADKEISDYYEELVKLTNDPKKSCSYVTTILLAIIKDSEELDSIEDLKFEVLQLAKVIELVNKDELSSTNSKLVIEELVING
jgi:aspartyl-tRNA(Asn)/glutamyl-tRNA(Gln) amidotransferase subunit B